MNWRRMAVVFLAALLLAMPVKADKSDTEAELEEIRARINELLAGMEARQQAPEPKWEIADHYPKPVITCDIGQYGQRTRVWADVRSRTVVDHDDDFMTPPEYKWWEERRFVPEGGEVFTWSYDGELAEDEYFQVMLICPNGEHRGIHPPTKDYYTVQGGSLRYIVQDCKGVQTRPWDHESFAPTRNVDITYTVAVVKWDGKDPGKIGPILAEADPEPIKI